MYVVKRNGARAPASFDKIQQRIAALAFDLPSTDVALVAQKVIAGVANGMTTSAIDLLAAETAVSMTLQHPEYAALAARIAVSNLHKNLDVRAGFAETYVQAPGALPVPALHRFSHAVQASMHSWNSAYLPFLERERAALDAAMRYDRDYLYDYFGYKTLEARYLLPNETPQDMLMRVAVALYADEGVEAAVRCYEEMSLQYYTHATPTLFNALLARQQLASCFLLDVSADSIDGIYETLTRTAHISKYAGGIGLSVSRIRARGTRIEGTGGRSNGLVPMLRMFNNSARYVDQGGGKRPGSIAVYLEPWHADVMDWLQLKRNHGNELERARDLFYALWVPDLFMRRVADDGPWTLFCPARAPGLGDVWGEAFDALYARYEAEREQRGGTAMRARDLFSAILAAQVETGTPYMLYKDACNAKSNHQHLGTIRCSNLCTEIIEYTAHDEIATCNLASVNLNAMLTERDGAPAFDFERLQRVTRSVTRNLNRVIDVTFYPLPETHHSNMRHRPIGIGVQGFADVLARLRLAFESDEARALNAAIFEHMYHAALDASCDLARARGAHASYAGSPVSRGILQQDMWPLPEVASVLDWGALRARIAEHGVRNSLLLAPMPTASTAQILGNTESFEPMTSNVYVRRVSAGEFIVLNRYLVNELLALGKWTPAMQQALVAARGSVQGMADLPAWLRNVYKTTWEISQRHLCTLSADRARYIDQSQSLNVFIAEPSEAKLTSLHFHTWRLGLKTGMYYLRTRPRADPIQFTVACESCTA